MLYRKQLFEAADEFNSSMILYNKKKRPSKMANKVKPAIVNLFDPNAVPSEIDPPKVNEPSPFNIQDKVNNFFNNPVNDFVRPMILIVHGLIERTKAAWILIVQ